MKSTDVEMSSHALGIYISKHDESICIIINVSYFIWVKNKCKLQKSAAFVKLHFIMSKLHSALWTVIIPYIFRKINYANQTMTCCYLSKSISWWFWIPEKFKCRKMIILKTLKVSASHTLKGIILIVKKRQNIFITF